MQQVFARTLLCPDLDTATDMARRSQLNCITLEGDEANRKGTLTGGYTDNLTLKLEAWKDFAVRVGDRRGRSDSKHARCFSFFGHPCAACAVLSKRRLNESLNIVLHITCNARQRMQRRQLQRRWSASRQGARLLLPS